VASVIFPQASNGNIRAEARKSELGKEKACAYQLAESKAVRRLLLALIIDEPLKLIDPERPLGLQNRQGLNVQAYEPVPFASRP
jgi:hypothetical protein